MLAFLHRIVWFAIATVIGGAWGFAEQLTGREPSPQANLVLSVLFFAALATAGYDLKKLLAWRREFLQIDSSPDLTPAQKRDALRLLQVLHERDPDKLRALREERRDRGGSP